jgi:hypothetical protein
VIPYVYSPTSLIRKVDKSFACVPGIERGPPFPSLITKMHGALPPLRRFHRRSVLRHGNNIISRSVVFRVLTLRSSMWIPTLQRDVLTPSSGNLEIICLWLT